MKKLIFTGLLASGMLASQCQILLNEIQTNGDDIVEIKNHGAMMVDVSTYRLCSWPTYTTIGDMTVISGSTNLMPGALVVLSGHAMGDIDDELGLYLDNSWNNPASIVDYVEWGSTGHTRSFIAQLAGIWGSGDFTEAAPMGTTLAWDGDGNLPANWMVGAEPSFGQENPTGGPCDDASCTGCTYAAATNYDSTVIIDDGSCVFEVCDITSDNQAVYDAAFTDGVASVVCPEDSCPADFDGNLTVNTSDLLDFLTYFDTSCE